MSGVSHIYADGNVELRGELYRPAGCSNGRAVLVVHEADGIGGNVRRRCGLLAELGYTALAADLHGGGQVLDGEEMREAVRRFRGDTASIRRRVRAGLEALAASAGTTPDLMAAIGYCFGGYAVLELARSGVPLRAVASFHGLLTTTEPATRGQIVARLAAFTGARDPLVPPEDVAAFQKEMMDAEANWRMSVYGQAFHSFTNRAVDALGDPRMRYDAEADTHSWEGMLGFFDASFRDAPTEGAAP